MKLLFSSILFSLFFIGMLFYLLILGDRVIEQHSQILNIIIEVRSEVMQGGIKLEESGYEDKEVTFMAGVKHFENADLLLKSMLEGNGQLGYTIFPLTDADLNRDISDLIKQLDRLRIQTRNHFDKYEKSRDRKNINQQYAISFDEFLIKLNSVESKFRQKLNQERASFNQTGNIIVLISILGALFITVMLQRMREYNKKQQIEINKVHEEVRKANTQLMKRIQYDALTNLPNRELFLHSLDSAISLAKRKKQWVVIFFIDLDKFKSINDYLGHDAGDKLLKSVAQRLRESVRGEDVVARLAGDEFTVMLAPENTQEDAIESAHNVAQKIKEVLVSPFKVDNSEPYVSASIGIALFPQDGRDSETLMKNADTSMYDVKLSGKNDYRFFSAELNEATQNRLQLEQDLLKAINDQQLELYFQPQWSFDSGDLFGLEVLLRWKHPEKGTILPGVIIPIAESCGLINDLDNWVLKTACFQLALWQKQGCAPSQISINISANQFYKPGLVKEVEAVLEKNQIEPKNLEFEITEEVLMRNPEHTSSILNALKQLGVKIAIDNFGSGPLSLAFLSKFPIDTLTLNRLFIQNVGVENTADSIVESLIKLAHKLDMTIVAEGIETEEQNTFLAAQHCNYAQGYLFNRPLNKKDIEVLLRFNKERISSSHPR